MRTATFITLILLLSHVDAVAQTMLDKSNIYAMAIESYPEKGLPIINETFSNIAKYDIDGDVMKWFYRRNIDKSKDSSELVVHLVCVSPVTYSQSVISYLNAKGISVNTEDMFRQIDNPMIDSVAKYVASNKILSWRNAPLKNSAIRNLFKKKKVMGLSSILMDESNNIALVRVAIYSKKKTIAANPSKIIILKRGETGWAIIGELKERV